MGDRLHQQQRALHAAQALPHHLDHVVAQPGAGLVQTRCVQQNELGVTPVHHAVNAVAGGLGLVRNDGDLLAHQRVGQAGLAHVGPSAYRDHRRFRNVFHQVILNFLSFELFVYLFPFKAQCGHDGLLTRPHLRLLLALVHVVVAQQVQHGVDSQIRQLTPVAVAVLLGLRLHPLQ